MEIQTDFIPSEQEIPDDANFCPVSPLRFQKKRKILACARPILERTEKIRKIEDFKLDLIQKERVKQVLAKHFVFSQLSD